MTEYTGQFMLEGINDTETAWNMFEEYARKEFEIDENDPLPNNGEEKLYKYSANFNFTIKKQLKKEQEKLLLQIDITYFFMFGSLDYENITLITEKNRTEIHYYCTRQFYLFHSFIIFLSKEKHLIPEYNGIPYFEKKYCIGSSEFFPHQYQNMYNEYTKLLNGKIPDKICSVLKIHIEKYLNEIEKHSSNLNKKGLALRRQLKDVLENLNEDVNEIIQISLGNPDLRKENSALKTEIATLKEENSKSKAEIESLKKENSELKDKLSMTLKENEKEVEEDAVSEEGNSKSTVLKENVYVKNDAEISCMQEESISENHEDAEEDVSESEEFKRFKDERVKIIDEIRNTKKEDLASSFDGVYGSIKKIIPDEQKNEFGRVKNLYVEDVKNHRSFEDVMDSLKKLEEKGYEKAYALEASFLYAGDRKKACELFEKGKSYKLCFYCEENLRNAVYAVESCDYDTYIAAWLLKQARRDENYYLMDYIMSGKLYDEKKALLYFYKKTDILKKLDGNRNLLDEENISIIKDDFNDGLKKSQKDKNLEDILASYKMMHDSMENPSEEKEKIYSGKIINFFTRNKYGFIKCDGFEDIFFHLRQVNDCKLQHFLLSGVRKSGNICVTFRLGVDPKDDKKYAAYDIKVCDEKDFGIFICSDDFYFKPEALEPYVFEDEKPAEKPPAEKSNEGEMAVKEDEDSCKKEEQQETSVHLEEKKHSEEEWEKLLEEIKRKDKEIKRLSEDNSKLTHKVESLKEQLERSRENKTGNFSIPVKCSIKELYAGEISDFIKGVFYRELEKTAGDFPSDLSPNDKRRNIDVVNDLLEENKDMAFEESDSFKQQQEWCKEILKGDIPWCCNEISRNEHIKTLYFENEDYIIIFPCTSGNPNEPNNRVEKFKKKCLLIP